MNELTRTIFKGMQIFTDDHMLMQHALVVENDIIKAIVPENMAAHHLPAKEIIFPRDHYLIPGFIDLHVHGAAGFDVMDGTEEALEGISKALAAEGVTSFLATTMTASDEQIEKVLTLIPEIQTRVHHAAILGIHLEGPFISPLKMGAQMQGKERFPDIKLMSRWQSLAKNTIKVVTLAPELPGALPFITTFSSQGVVMSIGHTNATFAQTNAGIEAGCSQATHLFNAMRPLHQREPGTVGAILLNNQVGAELIVDGEHLHPAIVELAYRLKGHDHLCLVTDAIRAKCMGDGAYELGGHTVTVRKGKAILKDDTLAGSTLRMPQAIKNMMNFSHCSLGEAINFGSLNPARILKIDDRKGSIEVSKDADLVVLNPELSVKLTMRGGKTIFK